MPFTWLQENDATATREYFETPVSLESTHSTRIMPSLDCLLDLFRVGATGGLRGDEQFLEIYFSFPRNRRVGIFDSTPTSARKRERERDIRTFAQKRADA